MQKSKKKKKNAKWACLLLFVFCYSCNHIGQEQLIRVFQPGSNFSNPVTTKVYTNGDYESPLYTTSGSSEFQSLYLNSDATFTLWNFKGSVLVGKWQSAHDTVVLTFAFRPSDIISFDIKLSKAAIGPFVTFIICDKTNHPIPNFLIQPFNDHAAYTYDSTGELTAQSTNKVPGFPENYMTDTAGTLRLEKKKYDSLGFTKLSYLTRKKFTISTRNLPDTVKLIININAIALADRRGYLIRNITKPDYMHLPPMKLILRGSRFSIPFD